MDPSVSMDPLKTAALSYVDRVIDESLSLQALPWMADRLGDLTRQGVVDPRRIANVIKCDLVFAAQTLGAVNRRAEVYGSRICSIDAAVTHLGTSWFTTLGEGQSNDGDTDHSLVPLRRLLWRHSVMRAEIAQCLAADFELWPDEAYACALLRDLGADVALRCIEALLSAQTSVRFSPSRCLELAHAYSADILDKLCTPWHLPRCLLRPAVESSARERELQELVELAELIAGSVDCDPCFGEQSLADLPALANNKIRETVTGAALGIAASVRYLDCQGPTSHLDIGAGSAVPQDSVACEDFEVGIDNMAAPYKCLEFSKTSIRVQGGEPSARGDVLRVELRRDFERFGFAVLVQECIPGAKGYILELSHLPVHLRASECWSELHKSVTKGSAPSPSTSTHVANLRLLGGAVSQAFAAIRQAEHPGPDHQVSQAIEALRSIDVQRERERRQQADDELADEDTLVHQIDFEVEEVA